MAIRSRYNPPTPRQRHDSAPQPRQCGFMAPPVDFTVVLQVWLSGRLVCRSRVLERGEVAEHLHTLRNLYPLADGYGIMAITTERTTETGGDAA